VLARYRRAGSPLRLATQLSFVTALSLAVAACGGSAPATFDLSAASGARGKAGRGQLVVAEPTAISPLESDRIVVRTSPEQVAFLTGAQWSDRLPRLMQSRLVQSFENGKLLRSVGRSGDKLVADYTLTSEIRRFEIDVTTSQAVVVISAKVVRESTGRIAAARIFTAEVPGSASDGARASVALDQALNQVMRDIVGWASMAM
jgi:cholesterol transport system auxiliary component